MICHRIPIQTLYILTRDGYPASIACKTEIYSPHSHYERPRFKIYNGPYLCWYTFTDSYLYAFVMVMTEMK